VSYTTADITQIYESLGHLLNEYNMATYDITNIRHLDDAMTELDNSIADYHNSIKNSSDEFTDSKVINNNLYLHTTYTHKIMQICTDPVALHMSRH
jgi:hypothetical protein